MFERCVYFNSNALARKVNTIWEKAFKEYNLPPSHAYLLRLVLEKPGQTQQEIAEELKLDKSTVTRFIHQLEKKGLLSRAGSQEDQRSNVINPTQVSIDLADGLQELGDKLYATMVEAIGEDQIEKFVRSLRVVEQRLEQLSL